MIFLLTLADNPTDYALLEHIYCTYKNQMKSVASKLLPNDSDAEDVVHDVICTVAEKYLPTLKRINNETGIRNYLLKATKNTAYNRLKCSGFNDFPLDSATTEATALALNLTKDDLLDTICANIEYQQMVDTILAMNDKYRYILYHHLILGLSLNDIAKQIHEKPATIRKQFSRGKALLIDSLNISKGDKYDNKR